MPLFVKLRIIHSSFPVNYAPIIGMLIRFFLDEKRIDLLHELICEKKIKFVEISSLYMIYVYYKWTSNFCQVFFMQNTKTEGLLFEELPL